MLIEMAKPEGLKHRRAGGCNDQYCETRRGSNRCGAVL